MTGVLGLGTLASILHVGELTRGTDGLLLLGLLAACILVGELLPITVPGHDDEVTTSTSFVFATLLVFGLAPAALVLAATAVASDVWLRKPLSRIAFNVAQYTLSIGAAGAILGVFGMLSPDALDFVLRPDELPVLGLAGAAFFVVNNVLAGAAWALHQRQSIVFALRADLACQASTAALLLGFAPLVVAAMALGPVFVPLLLLPIFAFYRGGREARLAEHHALHDRLTGLPNRVLLRDRTERSIAAARRSRSSVGVLIMDLDFFKDVNDTLGYHHGDLLLQQIADRLAERLRSSDTVARMGGDEFAVLLPAVRSAPDALAVGRDLLEALARPMVVGGVSLEVQASIGVACFPEHGDDVDALVQHADVAMYNAKQARTGVSLYDTTADPYSVERLVLAAQLREAIERRQIVVQYQPQVDLATTRLAGVEALVRWDHPDRGRLYPDAFIALAEQTGQIRELTLCVVEQAIAQVVAWDAAGLSLEVAVNVSARDLLDLDLPGSVEALLREHGLPAERLQLEITESMLVTDPHRAERVLAQLSRLGVRIAVDDFGTGYSSLTYLKRMPIDEIKVDRSFVLGMAADADDAAIVASTIGLGRNLGLRTVAEGIEDAETYTALREMGCTRAQGYHLSRPLDPAAVPAWAAALQAGEVRLGTGPPSPDVPGAVCAGARRR